MTAFSTHRLLWIASVATALALSSCGGCGGKKRSKKTSGATEQPVVEPPKDEPKKDPPKTVTDDKDVGEAVPPITPDSVATVDTTNGAALKHLILKTTDAQEAGRYLSEFLMVIRANDDSCVRLKVRPTSGLTNELEDDALINEIEGTGACEGQKIGGDGKEDEEKPAAEGAGLWLSNVPESGVTDNTRRSQSLSLTAADLPNCSARLFRMMSDGIEPVVVKTGRLLPSPANSKVRIWLDEEFANVCDTGGSVSAPDPTSFAPLHIMNGWATPIIDQLHLKFVENLIAEMNKIVTDINATYGSVSDIDQSGHIEIFMSPDVNRKYFTGLNAKTIDNFEANLIYRPEDLAYYNAETNPTSNEGEILYLWVPDPAGIYTSGEFPSANSISSNYAKGYLTAQISTLLFANQKLFVQKLKTMEERWVVEAVASLLSAYYAGNDYTFPYLIEYLTSRPQYLSLTNPPKPDLFSDKFLGTAHKETFGLRAMFGWYLHSKLCGTGVDACAKIKDMIVSKDIGKANVEKVIGLDLHKLLENFGLSVGVALLDDPAEAMKFWDKNPLPTGYPAKPTTLPELTEIFADATAKKRQTEENDNAGALLGGSKLDRTVAGPFPTKDSLLFQPVASDNDLEFKMAKNSVAYLLITGLVDPQTDVTAVFGKGLNVVFVPAGERDTTLRRLHVEKLSEQAHGDLRPENLTASSDPDTTYAYAPVYTDLDYSVTGKRELWILGSSDNYTISQEGTMTTVGDTDAYNVHIKPCAHLSGAAKTTCEGQDHTVVAQVIIRDFVKELSPMLVVTEPAREMFRGHSIYGRITEIDPEYVEPADHVGAMCVSAASIDAGNNVTFAPGNPGIVTWNDPANTLVDGDMVRFSADILSTLPRGLEPFRQYKVDVTAPGNTFTLIYPDTLDAVEIGQRGPHQVRDAAGAVVHVNAATITIGNPTIVTGANTLNDGDPVTFATDPSGANGNGILPEGLNPGAVYYVANSTATDFEIATDAAGTTFLTTTNPAPNTYIIHTGDKNICANGGVTGAKVYSDSLTQLDQTLFPHNYENFLMMGRLDYPYTTQNTLTWAEKEPCADFRCYMKAESQRQHLTLNIDKTEKSLLYTYYPTAKNLLAGATVLESEAVAKLAGIKRRIDSCDSPDTVPDGQSEGFVTDCTSVANLTEEKCKTACGTNGNDIQNAVLNYISSENVAILCRGNASCADHETLTSQGSFTKPWIPLHRYYWYGSSNGSQSYYYRPIEPTDKTGYCSGGPGDGFDKITKCSVKIEDMAEMKDIRNQLHVTPERLQASGCGGKIGTDFGACIDSISWSREVAPDRGYQSAFWPEQLPTDRVRVARPDDIMPIAARAGETLGKPERLQYVVFNVPGTGAVTNFIVGGRDESQGKYLLRVRVKD